MFLQAADVGVGISGEEGLQAVNSSDYAIGQVSTMWSFFSSSFLTYSDLSCSSDSLRDCYWYMDTGHTQGTGLCQSSPSTVFVFDN